MSRISEKKAKDQCSICLSEDLLQARETRNTKKDNWIRCDCCKLWFHASCGGYTQAQYSKVQKENIWLKCVINYVVYNKYITIPLLQTVPYNMILSRWQ